MSDILKEICGRKAEHVAARKKQRPLSSLKDFIANAPPTESFTQALRDKTGPAIIAELKKASPSKGLIRDDFHPSSLAREYQNGGAACLSVLTDEPYFQGRDDYISIVKQSVNIPVLRKDFIIDSYQIYESRSLGADCILLIMAALSDEQAAELYDTAQSLDLDVLIETHDETEIERALRLDPAMIGVNNRNLKTMEVSLETAGRLAPMIPHTILKIAESGIYTSDDIRRLQRHGYQGFLIGESLMKADNPGQALKELRDGC